MDLTDNKEPLLSVEAPTAYPVESDLENWRSRAEAQISSIIRLQIAMAVLAALGILCVCLLAYDDIEIQLGLFEMYVEGRKDIEIQYFWFAAYMGVPLAVLAGMALCMERRIQKQQTLLEDDDNKDAKSRRDDKKRRQLLASFLFFVALFCSLQIIWMSMDVGQRPLWMFRT